MKNALAALIGSPRSTGKAGYSAPPDLRIYAVGDVHGRFDLFERMLAAVEEDVGDFPPENVRLVLLGDLIDRGPESAQVVERARQLREASDSVRLLMGNHEEIFLQILEGEIESLPFFLKIGGRPTIMSYGITDREILTLKSRELVDLLIERVPPAHVELLRSMENVVRYGDVVFVHAGVRPGVPIDEQKLSDLRWIRSEFLSHRRSHGALIVHGHNVTETVEDHPNRIGIDTGAFATGRLSILALEGATRRFLTVEGEPDSQWAASIPTQSRETLAGMVKRMVKRD